MRTARCSSPRPFAYFLLLTFLGSPALVSQGPSDGQETGAALYREAANSVLWIEVLDASGSVVGTGSGFLAEGGHVLTSAHVVARGTPRIRFGSVALNARVERLDVERDLATLAIEGELSLAGLPLAAQSPPPGTSVWVIGNPQGLERTISAGTTSGTRTEDGVSYLQLSAPVSPGSSGGPVLTSDGKVVGVVRMTLEAGQNLNFAVPIESVRAFLASTGDPSSVSTFQDALQLLAAERGPLVESPDPSRSRPCHLAQTAIALAGDDKERWLEVVTIASEDFRAVDCPQEHLTWARKAYRMFGAGHEASFDVYSASLMEVARAAAPGTPERSALWREAVLAFEQENRVRPRSSWSLWADLAEAASNLEDHVGTFEKAIEKAIALCHPIPLLSNPTPERKNEAVDCRHRVGLLGFDHLFAKGDIDEAQKALLVATGVRSIPAAGNSFTRFFDMIEDRWLALHFKFGDARRYAEAAQAAAIAAQLWEEARSWDSAFDAKCRSAISAAFADRDDDVLQRGRECIDLSSKATNTDGRLLGWTHWKLAEVLQERGLPDPALVHTQQALALLDSEKDRGELGDVYRIRASALLDLDRPSESLAASKQALRLTDGAVGSVHFTAGAAAFDLQDFTAAERYFRKASELSPADASAVFNVALCLENQGFQGDAAVWYRKYLKLESDPENRRRVERKLSGWGF
jgi:tetratricopeptide (TPR) repeat protein